MDNNEHSAHMKLNAYYAMDDVVVMVVVFPFSVCADHFRASKFV